MDEHYYSMQGLQRREPSRTQHNVPRPQLAQATRSFAPRERYRAIQFDYPVFDPVEDDEGGQSPRLDLFDGQMLHQQCKDWRSYAVQDPAALSSVPTAFGSYDVGVLEEKQSQTQTQSMYQQTFYDRDHQAYPDGSVHASLHNATMALESSSHVPPASSSPALTVGRRRAGFYEASVSRYLSGLQTFEVLRPKISIDCEEGARYGCEDDLLLSKAPPRDVDRPLQQITRRETNQSLLSRSHTAPTVQGIPLVPISALADRLQAVFPYPTFNAVQSKCYNQVFKSDNNFVLSSPTGSGKTAILELAICRAIATTSTGQYKVVYQAPTKALCSERHRDWDKKFKQIGMKCAELTGDSDASDLRNVQSANIIVTTPEKWDSMTRKWKDHEKLMKLIKLFLIDEVHILNDDRGAVLEAVVSRMKSISTNVRFIALSATVPNFHDVAAWLGKNSSEPHVPAPNERFGEEFRPVRLRKHVCGYICNSNNEWAFEKRLDAKLPEIITIYSEGKPMMIFCATRKSCVATARLIAKWWGARSGRDRLWSAPSQAVHIQDKELRNLVASGVAFHHAGVNQDDRIKVERGFLQGDISVICCTSTLAVGVNLPCYLVIIKNTMSWSQVGLQEYSDLELMQMLGRAGRPQFDDSAVAVIMTRQAKVQRYETLVTGEEILESKLHLNLIEHLNAEIGLATIQDLNSARRWLSGTFMYVRLRQNPVYYKLEGSHDFQNIHEQVDNICFRDIAVLKEHGLVTGDEYLRCTEFGHAMARYYIQFSTMKVFMNLQPKSTLSEILSAVAQAAEFSRIRFRQGEKSLYKTLNKSPSIRFPIPVSLDLPAHKVSLVIQSVLGHADICWDGDASKHRQQYTQEVATIFKSTNGLIRCIIDCQIVLGDSTSIHSALMLERCLGSKAWDDSPLQMIQIPNIGAVAVRKLVNAGIRGIEDLETTNARRIETVVGRNPPFGLKVLDDLKSFPKLRVSLHLQPSSVTKTLEGVKVQVKAEIGFINDKPPDKFGNKLIYVCMLAETSDGRKVYFTRMSGSKLGAGQSLIFPALLTRADQRVNCYLMCEGIAGSMRDATVVPKIAPAFFPCQGSKPVESAPTQRPNISRRRIENAQIQRMNSVVIDEFDDADIDDDALVKATYGDIDFEHIDSFAEPSNAITRGRVNNRVTKEKGCTNFPLTIVENTEDLVPVQLPNGRWSCNHKCKDKEACKHYCCKHGMERPPKRTFLKRVSSKNHREPPPLSSPVHLELQSTASKRKMPTAVEELDLTQQEKKRNKVCTVNSASDYRDLHLVHRSAQKKDMPSSLHSVMHTRPACRNGEVGECELSLSAQKIALRPKTSNEYGDLELDEVADELSAAQIKEKEPDKGSSFRFPGKISVSPRGSDAFGDDDSTFGEAIVSLADSHELQRAELVGTLNIQNHQIHSTINARDEISDVEFPVDFDFASPGDVKYGLPKHRPRALAHQYGQAKPPRIPAPLIEAKSSSELSQHFKPTVSTPQCKGTRDSQPDRVELQETRTSKGGCEDGDVYSDLLSLLDMPLPTNKEDTPAQQAPVVSETLAYSVEQETKESQQVPEGSKDLQSWLFHEFGGIVELVDE